MSAWNGAIPAPRWPTQIVPKWVRTSWNYYYFFLTFGILKFLYQQYFGVEYMHVTEQPQFFCIVRTFHTDGGRFVVAVLPVPLILPNTVILNAWLLAPFLSSLLLFANTFPTSPAGISVFAGCVSPFHFDLHSSLPSEMGTCFIRLKLSLNIFLLAQSILI